MKNMMPMTLSVGLATIRHGPRNFMTTEEKIAALVRMYEKKPSHTSLNAMGVYVCVRGRAGSTAAATDCSLAVAPFHGIINQHISRPRTTAFGFLCSDFQTQRYD